MRQTGSNGAGEATRRELGHVLEGRALGCTVARVPKNWTCSQGQEHSQGQL